jgi:hypothetical protein
MKYIVGQKESEDALSLYFKTVFLRPDLLESLTKLLTLSAVEALDRDLTKDKAGQFIVKVASNPKVRQ